MILSTDLRELGENVVVDAVHEEGVVLEAAAVLEGQHGDRGAGVGRCGCGGWLSLNGLGEVVAGSVVPPEEAAAGEKQERDDGHLRAANALLPSVAVVPSQNECNRQTNQKGETREFLQLVGPLKEPADVLEALQEPPGRGDVDQSPLHHLAPAQPRPGALGCTLCRRVGHLPPAVVWLGGSGSFILRRKAL